jgi:putative transposase
MLDHRSDLLVTRIDALRDAVRQVRVRAPFRIDAWVVLPDHMHCLWTLPEGDADFPVVGARSIPYSRNRCPPANRDHPSWAIGATRHPAAAVLGAYDPRRSGLAAHMDYSHFKSVKHGLVEHPADWPYSSVRRRRAVSCRVDRRQW